MEEKVGWIETELSQISEIIMGQSPPSSTYNENSNGLPFFQGKAEFTELHPIVSKWCSEPNKIAEPNDILISVRAPVGATNIANQRCCIGRGLAAIRYPDCNKYVFYFLRLIEKELDKKGTGTTFKAISGTVLKSEIIPLPPLPEQRAIASKIEQLFSDLDNGIANLRLAQEQLKVYRQAVLDETTKTEKFVPIASVIEELGQGWSPKCHNEPSTNDEEWGVIKTTAIQNGYFNEKENKKLPASLEPRVKHELKVGDILITRAGPRVRVGVCCLVKKVRPRLINCDKVYRIRLKENLILPEFFEYALNSPKYTLKIEEIKTGISDSGLNLTQNRFLDLEIPLPPLPEQHAIVEEIETRLSVCDKMAQDIDEALEKAEALRQSILKKAFEGKLLSEKELAEVRSAEDWEPADVLLERVRAERLGNGKK